MKNEKEFTFSFSHYAFRSAAEQWNKEKKDCIKPIRVGIMLLAERVGEDPARKESITVAASSFPPGQKPDTILMTGMDVDNEVIGQLLKQGCGKEVKREGKWVRIDVTDFYNRYMKEHEQMTMESPISHVSQCQGQKVNGKDPEDFMKCRIGGIEQKPQWSGITGREFFEVAALYPDCRFQLKELAQEAFQKQLETYQQAKARVTDATVVFNKNIGCHYLRCKIDGEQQFMKEVDRLDICDFQVDKDIHALAAKYYEKELDTGMKRSQGRSL
ncbi:MAG: hypothetical protein Q4C03_07525 [bacterium]|nr:hypothetical protein [bacterium]